MTHDDPQKEVPADLLRRVDSAIADLEKCAVWNEDVVSKAEDVKDELMEYVPESQIGITEEERLMIVQAMQMKQGQWWRCGRGESGRTELGGWGGGG